MPASPLGKLKMVAQVWPSSLLMLAPELGRRTLARCGAVVGHGRAVDRARARAVVGGRATTRRFAARESARPPTDRRRARAARRHRRARPPAHVGATAVTSQRVAVPPMRASGPLCGRRRIADCFFELGDPLLRLLEDTRSARIPPRASRSSGSASACALQLDRATRPGRSTPRRGCVNSGSVLSSTCEALDRRPDTTCCGSSGGRRGSPIRSGDRAPRVVLLRLGHQRAVRVPLEEDLELLDRLARFGLIALGASPSGGSAPSPACTARSRRAGASGRR